MRYHSGSEGYTNSFSFSRFYGFRGYFYVYTNTPMSYKVIFKYIKAMISSILGAKKSKVLATIQNYHLHFSFKRAWLLCIAATPYIL